MERHTQGSCAGDLAKELAPLLQTRCFGRVHRHAAQLASTNDEALDWLERGGAHGALVTADRQNQGRGRLGRAWESGDAGQDIYATLLLRLPARDGPKGALGLAIALGLATSLAEQGRGLGEFALKWPNDVLLSGRKIAGILCEARWTGDEALVAAGFGVNVAREQFQDAKLRERATSLAIAAKAQGLSLQPQRRAPLLADLLLQVELRVQAYLEHGFGAIAAPYRALCRDPGGMVRLSAQGPDKAPPGTMYRAVDLDEDGALLVQRPPSTRLWRVHGGEVWLASPEG